MEESPTLDCGATEKEHTKEMVRSFNKGFEFFSLFFFPHEFVILTLSPEHDSLMQTSEQHVIFHRLVRKPITSGEWPVHFSALQISLSIDFFFMLDYSWFKQKFFSFDLKPI